MTIFDFRSGVTPATVLAVSDRMRVSISSGTITHAIYGKEVGHINDTTTGGYTLLNFVFLNGIF
jgi:hypothetical protein